jgi:hypothetical protein
MCIDGIVYGPCEHPLCSGVCESEGDCQCRKHGEDAQHEPEVVSP